MNSTNSKQQNPTYGQAGRSDLRRSATKAQESRSSDNLAASQSWKHQFVHLTHDVINGKHMSDCQRCKELQERNS